MVMLYNGSVMETIIVEIGPITNLQSVQFSSLQSWLSTVVYRLR